jgi:uncharacterized membrane protein YqgA involved in biofilm formation
MICYNRYNEKLGSEEMLAVVVNSLTIIIGVVIGLLFKNIIPKKVSPEIFKAIGLSVLVIGLQGALKTANPILMVVSLSVGTLFGTLIDIDKRMSDFGDKLEKKFSNGDESTFSKAIVNSSILFCSGAMAIVGSLEAGIAKNYDTLFVKSIIDGISSVFLTLSFGVGVIFSSVATFIYQGAITLSSSFIEPFITDAMVLELSAIGSVMIAAIGLNMIGAAKIKIANLLPGILIPIIYYLIWGYFNGVVF